MARLFRRENTLLFAIAAGKLALNVAFHGRYGYFRDELYYLACADHLAWGYVDHPPLSIAILDLTRALLGDSLYAIRLPAALAGAGMVVLTGLIARRLGGGRAAQLIAALAAAMSPVVLGNAGRYFSMNAFDLLFWAWGAYLVVTLLLEDRPRLWLAFGAVAGLGLLNKYSLLFLCCGLCVGLLLTRQRRQFRQRWFWLGVCLAAVLFLPHLLWQMAHDWPSLEFMRAAAQEKNIALSPVQFFLEQILQVGFLQAPLWLGGLLYFVFHPRCSRLRPLAWLYPAVFAVMVTGGAKAYYLTPIYAPYLAAGAVWLEAKTARGGRTRLRAAFAAALAALNLVVLPLAIPCLPVARLIRYTQTLGITPRAEENHALAELPQSYADQFGWPEMVAQVAGIYAGLHPEERAHTVIYVRNYGQAAAIDFFGRQYGLPRALCPHNSYWLWRPEERDMQVAIIMGDGGSEEENRADLEGPGRFGSVRLAAVTDCRYCMPFERGRHLFVCRDPQFTFEEIWDGERFYY